MILVILSDGNVVNIDHISSMFKEERIVEEDKAIIFNIIFSNGHLLRISKSDFQAICSKYAVAITF